MIIKYRFSVFLLIIIFIQALQADDIEDTIYNFKLKSIDENNAEIEIEKKRNFFDYTLKYKLKKDIDYNTNSNLTSFNNQTNEDFSNLIFNNHFYFNDSMWIDVDMSYKDATEQSPSVFDDVLNQQKNTFENSAVKLVFKPNSIFSTNLIFEDYDVDTYDNIYSSGYLKKSNNKLTLNIKGEFNLFTIETSIYKSEIDSDYLYAGDYSDKYFESSGNNYDGVKFGLSKRFDKTFFVSLSTFSIVRDYRYLYDDFEDDSTYETTRDNQKGFEVSFSKKFFDKLKIVGSGKIVDSNIFDSNESSLVGNKPAYLPKRKANLSLEYSLKKAKLFGKFSHVSARYTGSDNSDRLDAYTIGTIGASFNSKLNDKDIRFDINIENVFDEEYYLYSDTLGRSRTLFFNITIKL